MLHDGVQLIGDSDITRELVSRRGNAFPLSPVNGQLFQLTEVFNTYNVGVYVYSDTQADWILQSDEENNPYDIGLTGPGRPKADAVVAQVVMVRTMNIYADFAESLAICGVAPTAEAVFEVNVLDGSGAQVDQLGTITYAISSLAGVFNPSTPGQTMLLQRGDVLSLKAPTVRDATIQNISITLAGQLAILND